MTRYYYSYLFLQKLYMLQCWNDTFLLLLLASESFRSMIWSIYRPIDLLIICFISCFNFAGSKLYHGQCPSGPRTHGNSEHKPLHSDDKTCSLTVWMSQTWQKERRHRNLHFSKLYHGQCPSGPRTYGNIEHTPLHSDDRLVLWLSECLKPDRRKEGTQTCTFLSSTMANALQAQGHMETERTHRFIRMIDLFFDCLNVSNLTEGKKARKPALFSALPHFWPMPFRPKDTWRQREHTASFGW